MVFFNYSTMQVAAKIVYYGPGLCGKTTNLQYLYDHTTSDSRGEMVSLQTETDRTLFFDLLPIDLGSIGGFKTKIQLYTVPGQVFYNTTRRLVLKGVDGIVFVADSQRLMMDANVDSLDNLVTNLAEIGVDLNELPMVLQFNKRDLPDVAPVDALKEALNRHDWPCYEASALTGQGVFETLAGVAKLTLASLKERLGSERGGTRSGGPPRPRISPQTAPRATPQAAPRVAPQTAPPPRPSTQTATAAAAPATATVAAPAPQTAPSNGHVELERDLSLELPTSALRKARRLSVSLRLEDDDRNVVGVVQRGYPLDEHPDLSELLLRLSLSVTPGDQQR
jgi:signal recognition particle receptor subunit beta